MASLLNTREISELTGIAIDHFDTFKIPITIIKEDSRSFSDYNIRSYPGYQNSNLSSPSIEFTQVSGIFYGLKVGPGRGGNQNVQILQTATPQSQTYIKVESNCRDYIKSGKTEKIICDGITYGITSEEKSVNYLGLVYYIFDIAKQN